MIWDLRTCVTVLPLHGHFKQVLCSDFHRDGYQLATGSQDNTVRIWDLRKRATVNTIPAHLKLVSDLHFERNYSRFLYTASYDGTCKVFSSKDWCEKYSIDMGDNRISSVSMTEDSNRIIATTMEKKIHVYERKKALGEDQKIINELNN
jgi:U4/U6 small nuclear ribonucleoprotein PRP4